MVNCKLLLYFLNRELRTPIAGTGLFYENIGWKFLRSVNNPVSGLPCASPIYKKKLDRPWNNSSGFTLIELLVVIMIIGILSVIALPAFLNQVNKAKEVEAIQATKYLSDRQSERFHQELNFTNNLNQLNFYLDKKTENYCYDVFADNNYLNGAVHVGLSKKPGLKSYASVIYYQNEQMLKCQPVPIQVSCPASSFEVFRLIADVVANPKKYCP